MRGSFEDGWHRRWSGPLGAVFAVGAAVRVWVLLRPMAALHRVIPDDAYIVMEIARNIGQGRGPRFVDYLTNGFQPLFVWLAAVPFWLTSPSGLDPARLDLHLKLALAVSCVFDLGSLLLLATAVRRGTGSRAAGLLAALVWALHPAVLHLAFNGLETAMAVFFLLALWNLILRRPLDDSTPARLFGIGLLAGVAVMARVDLVFVGIFFAVEAVRSLRAPSRGPSSTSRWLARYGSLAAGCVVGYAPWMLYSWLHTGRIVPESGAAVRWITLTHARHALDGAFYLDMLRQGVTRVDDAIPALFRAAVLTAAILLGRHLWRRSRPSPGDAAGARSGAFMPWLAFPALVCGSLYLLYTLHVHATWFFSRYLAPVYVLAVAVVAAGVARLAVAAGRRGWLVWAVATASTVLGTTVQPDFGRLLSGPPDTDVGYRPLGLWAREAFPPGTVVGAAQAGALAYYASGQRVVNLDGVVNDRAYREAVAGGALDYAREEGVDYLVVWRRNYEYLRLNSGEPDPDEVPLLGHAPGLRSWGFRWEVRRVGRPDGRAPPPLEPPS